MQTNNIMDKIVTSLPIQIIDIYNDYNKHVVASNINVINANEYSKEYELNCWVRDFRSQSNLIFINVYDGSTSYNLQVVCNKDTLNNFNDLENLRGATIFIKGNIIKSLSKSVSEGQEIEMQCTYIKPIGLVNDSNSIILAKKIQLDTLRNHQHLRTDL